MVQQAYFFSMFGAGIAFGSIYKLPGSLSCGSRYAVAWTSMWQSMHYINLLSHLYRLYRGGGGHRVAVVAMSRFEIEFGTVCVCVRACTFVLFPLLR